MSFEHSISKSLILELERGLDLILSLDEKTYASAHGDSGSIGAHFRHNHDFIQSFLDGLESGEIDYCARSRDLRIERERKYAGECLSSLITRIKADDGLDSSESLKVRSEIDENIWLDSSVGRELEFIHSHTVHHYALISAKLRALNIKIPREFGVAPSTLKYWKSIKTKANKA